MISIHRKRLLFSLHGRELRDLSIQPNNLALVTLWKQLGVTLFCVSCIHMLLICFCFLVLDIVQSTSHGINGLGSTCYHAFTCYHRCHGWTVLQGWQHVWVLSHASLKWLEIKVHFPFSRCYFTRSQPVVSAFPEFCFCKLNWPNYAQVPRLADQVVKSYQLNKSLNSILDHSLEFTT